MEGGCLKGRGLAEDERERSQPPALRATSFQRKEGEAVKTIYSLPMEGGCLKGWGLAEGERERSQPPALRATSFQRKEGEVVKKHFLPSHGRGMPEGQGDGRRRKRAKPTSGATRHLLPEEGGKSGEKPSPPFPRKGDARRAGGWAKAKERKANLRRCAPPPSRGRREKRDE